MQSSSRNGAKTIWLAVHTTEGIMRARDLLAWASWSGSSHASNDETGVLLTPDDGFVPYDRAAWTLRNANPWSDNLEQCAWAHWTRPEWLARPLLLDTTARWLADRHLAQPWIPLRRLTDAEIRARVPGVLGHGDYSRATGDGTHTDPGPNYPWDVVLAQANAYATGEDMPLSQDDLNKISVIVRDWSAAAVTAQTIDWGGGRKVGVAQQAADNAKAIAALSGQFAALTQAISQTGAGLDLSAVKAAAKAGTDEALAGFEATVVIGAAQPPA